MLKLALGLVPAAIVVSCSIVMLGVVGGFAATFPACRPGTIPLDQVVANIELGGGELLALEAIPGRVADQLLIARHQGHVVVGAASRGCVISSPLPIDEVASPSRGVPA